MLDAFKEQASRLRYNSYRRHLGGSGARKMRAVWETVSQVIGSEQQPIFACPDAWRNRAN